MDLYNKKEQKNPKKGPAVAPRIPRWLGFSAEEQ